MKIKGGTTSVGGNKSKFGHFTGLAVVTPVIFNPTKKEYKEITGRELYSDDYYGLKSSYDDSKYSRARLLVKIDPNKNLQLEEEKYAPFYEFVDIDVACDLVKSKDSGKYCFLNSKMNGSTYAIDEAALPKWYTESVKIEDEVIPTIVKKAKKGEACLYNLLAAMSPFYATKANPVAGFMMGETAEEADEWFDDIVGGDKDKLNDILKNPIFCNEDGTPRDFKIMLGIKFSDKRNDAGEAYMNHVVFINRLGLINTFMKPEDKPTKKFNDELTKGNFKADYQGTVDFRVYDREKAAMKSIETNVVEYAEEGEDEGLFTSPNFDVPASDLVDDDLPF